MFDTLAYALFLVLGRAGVPGLILGVGELGLIVSLDDMPLREGDWGSDTIYHDYEEGKYWRIVYWFDKDGNVLSYTEYFSWDGHYWVLVEDTCGYPTDEELEK